MNIKEIILLISGVILFIAAVLVCFYHDMKDAKNGHINHSRGLLIKIGACSLSGVCFALSSNFIWIIALLSSAFMVASFFHLFFEMLWSVKVYSTPFHKSTATGKNKSGTDKDVEKLPMWAIIAIKLSLVLVSLYVYNIGLQK